VSTHSRRRVPAFAVLGAGRHSEKASVSRTPPNVHPQRMAVTARSDHRVEKMVDSAPGTGRPVASARMRSKTPRQVEAATAHPDSRLSWMARCMPKAWLGINGEMSGEKS